jgi:acetyl esterase/lipase
MPAIDAQRPTIVLIHGGYWRAPWDASLMSGLEADLRRDGWRVANIEYRALGSGGGWPTTFDDVLAAVDAAGPGPVVPVGHSAGGQLALWAAAERPVAGAVGQAPVADLQAAWDLSLSGRVVEELLGGGPDRVPERFARCSPLSRLPLAVPQLIVHGDADEAVPVDLGRRYAAAAQEAGDDVRYVELPGVGHFEHLESGHRAWRTVRDWLAERWP